MNDIERISILLNEAGIEHSGYTLQAPRLEALINLRRPTRKSLTCAPSLPAQPPSSKRAPH